MFATDIYLEELPSCWWHINFKEAVLQRLGNTTEVHIFYNSTTYIMHGLWTHDQNF